MSFDIRPFLQIDYWFTTQPPANVMSGLGRLVFAAFVGLFVIGMVIRVVNKHRGEDRLIKQAIARVGTMFIVMGLLGTFIFFLSFQQIPFLGAPFWYLIWLLGALVWIGWIVRFVKIVIPERRARANERKEQDKYLPNTKRRN